MHELSIAHSIVDIVRQYVQGPDLKLVRSIRVKVGEHSGVVVDSLEFSFSAITAETDLKSSRLDVDRIPFVIECRSCGARSRTEWGVARCPVCGASETAVVSGTELQVLDIELDDTPSEGS